MHFWQNDWDLLHATAVTRGWNGYQNKSTESRPWRRKFSRRSSRDSNLRPFNLESGALTTELSPPRVGFCCCCCPFFLVQVSVLVFLSHSLFSVWFCYYFLNFLCGIHSNMSLNWVRHRNMSMNGELMACSHSASVNQWEKQFKWYFKTFQTL